MTPNRVLAFDLLLAAGYAVGVYAIVVAALRGRSSRHRSHLVLLAAGASFVAAITFVVRPDRGGRYPDEPAMVIGLAFVIAVIGAVAAAHTLISRLPDRGTDWQRAVAAGAVLIIGFAGLVVLADKVDTPAAQGFAVAAPLPAAGAGTVDETYPLPAGPLDVALDGPRSGYLSAYPGEILRFRLPENPGGALVVETVASGLDHPRGLALLDGTLFAALVGPTVCPDPANLACRSDLTPVEQELATVASSAARIVAFPVGDDGALGVPATIVSDLPVTSFDHAVNAVEAGPDGRLYATIGSYSDLSLQPDLAAVIDHPNADLLGTVISFLPDGSDLRVHARGFRNPYDLAFTPDGDLYTVDNDGEALNSIRREELLRVEAGGHYGWPADGSFAPFTDRTHFPAWLLNQVGSSGVEWTADLSGREGLVMGALSSVRFAEFGTRAGAAGLLVGSPASMRRLVGVEGYATTVDQLGDGRLLVGVFSPWAPESHALLVVSVEL